MRFSTSRAVLASAAFLVGVASAQNISQQCQSALLTIAASPESSCLNPGGLLGVLTAGSNASLVQPISSWLADACAQDPCTNQSLSDIVANLTSGCQSDLSQLGFESDDTSEITQIIQEAYPTVRQVACLKTTSNNTLCIQSLLTDLQNTFGTLSVSNVIQTIPQVISGTAQDVPQSVQCSDCVKQAYNIIASAASGAATPSQSGDVQSALESQCGAAFVDGSTPSGVVEGTGSAAPTDSASAALSLAVPAQVGVLVSVLGAVASAFFVLA